MAKKMVYFNATKKLETITIHYNDKLDGAFVDDVYNCIKDISKNMKKINLEETKSEEYDEVTVFVYPSVKLFNQVFNGVIEKRYYNRKRSLEDFYIVQDEEGNIHIASPRGKSQEKVEALKRILVMKVLGEYMDEKDKQMAEKMLKASMLKEKEKDDEEKELEEQDEENIEEDLEEKEELTEEELDELVETENELEDIDEQEDLNEEEEKIEQKEETEQLADEAIPDKVREARQWLSVGWMEFLKGKLSNEETAKYFAEHISKNGVKKLGKLKDNNWFGKYEYSKEYAMAIVEYIVATYGVRKFIKFYQDPTDYKHIFGTTKMRFEQDAKAYIYSRYSASKMKEKIEEKEDYEVTEVTISNGGRVEMNSLENNEPKKETKIIEETFLGLDNKI